MKPMDLIINLYNKQYLSNRVKSSSITNQALIVQGVAERNNKSQKANDDIQINCCISLNFELNYIYILKILTMKFNLF